MSPTNRKLTLAVSTESSFLCKRKAGSCINGK